MGNLSFQILGTIRVLKTSRRGVRGSSLPRLDMQWKACIMCQTEPDLGRSDADLP